MRRLQRDQEKERADDARLLCAWREWHREQLEEALAGVRRDVLKRLMEQLKDLRSACALVDFIAAQDWESVNADTRAIALFEINRAITALRERQKLLPINDALPGEPLTAFPDHPRNHQSVSRTCGEARRSRQRVE
jgi:hypothetical protein